MSLTNEQIEAVVYWMNTWEQLKDTAIPIRFREDFGKSKRPPEGVMPKWLHNQIRLQGLREAIIKYADAGLSVPIEWVLEFNELSGVKTDQK